MPLKQQIGGNAWSSYVHALDKRKVFNQCPWKNKTEEKLNQSEQQKKINVLLSFTVAGLKHLLQTT